MKLRIQLKQKGNVFSKTIAGFSFELAAIW